MGKVTMQDLASVLVERWHIEKKEASQFVNEMFFLIQKSLDEDKIVKVKGLGTFKIIDVDDRESVNVNTGDRVLIEGHGKITFTPDALMKELVNKPFSQFETVVLRDGVDFNEADTEPEVAEAPVETLTTDEVVTLNETAVSEEKTIPEEKVVSDHVVSLEDLDDSSSSAPLVDFVTEEPSSQEVEAAAQIPPSPEPSEPSGLPELSEPSGISDILEPSGVASTEEPEPESLVTLDDDSSSEEILMGEEDESFFKKYFKWIALALLTLVVGILIGYMLGHRSDISPVQEAVPEPVDNEVVKPLPVDSDSVKVDSSAVVEKTPEVKEDTKVEKDIKIEAATPEPKVEERSLDKWEKMDVRVRTGAYRIIGTAEVVKARPGDNLARICKRTIGPGMECYIEVYNGLPSGAALKAGQKIEIPKLELKKKKQP